MKSQIITYPYEGENVEFDLTSRRVWVNATQMAKICGKQVGHYLELKSTSEFTSALVNRLNFQQIQKNSRYRDFDQEGLKSSSGYRDSDIQTPHFTEQDVIRLKRGGHQQGTWMDRVQALHFAAWLDAEFAVWVFMTIEEILFGQTIIGHQELDLAVIEEIRRKELESKFGKDPEYRELQTLRGKKGGYVTAVKTKAKHQLDIFTQKQLHSNEVEIKDKNESE